MSSSGEEARKKLLRRKKVEKMMELAFEGDLAQFRRMLDDPKDGLAVPIDPTPPAAAAAAKCREDSFLGEAACGNAKAVVEFLLSKGADPNWLGQQGRTPLMRAVISDAADVVAPLLAAGADPRLLFPQERSTATTTGTTETILFREWDAAEVTGLSCEPAIKDMLRGWDIARTLALVSQRASATAAAAATTAAKAETAVATAQLAVANVATLREQLAAATQERATALQRETRLREHDTAKAEGRPAASVELAARLIDEAVAAVDALESRRAELQRHLALAEAKARADSAVAVESGSAVKSDVAVGVAQLEDVVFADVGGAVAASGRPTPLVVDPSGTALTFLGYRHAIVLDIGNTRHMSPMPLRLSVLGSLRFGKPLVVGLRDKPLAESLATLQARLEAVRGGLFDDAVLTRRIRQPAAYEALISPEVEKEDAELTRRRFTPTFTERFTLVLVTANALPESERLKPFYVVAIAASA